MVLQERRTILVILCVAAVHGVWILEQPHSSLITRHRRFQWLVRKWQRMGVRVPGISHVCKNSGWYISSQYFSSIWGHCRICGDSNHGKFLGIHRPSWPRCFSKGFGWRLLDRRHRRGLWYTPIPDTLSSWIVAPWSEKLLPHQFGQHGHMCPKMVKRDLPEVKI